MDRELYASPVVVLPHETDDLDERGHEWHEKIPFKRNYNGFLGGNDLDALNFQGTSDSLGGEHRRYLGFMETWTKCVKRIKNIIREIHTQLTDDLIDFLNDAYLDSGKFNVSHAEVPVALVVGDTNLAAEIFDFLQQFLRDDVAAPGQSSPFLSTQLNPKDCSSVVAAMRSLISGFVEQKTHVDTPPKKRRVTRLANHDIALLQAWYDHLGETSPAHHNARLVVFLPNVELCDADVLRDVLHICSLYIPLLPLIFVLGTATSQSVLHSMLPVTLRAKIAVESFQLQRGLSTFESLMRGLFLDEEFDLGLLLTRSSYDQLKNSYTQHEQSIDSFQATMQLIFADHFSISTSVFCYSDMLGEENQAIKILRASESEYFTRRLNDAVEKAIRKFPNAAACVEIGRQRQKKTRTPRHRLDEVEALQTLAFVANSRAEFNDHHAALKMALRLLRRVGLEVRSHTAEMKTSLAALLGAVLHETIMHVEVATVTDRIEQLPLGRLEKLVKVVKEFCSTVPEIRQHLIQPILENVISWESLLALIASTSAPPQASPLKINVGRSFIDIRPPDVISAAKDISRSMATYFEEKLPLIINRTPLAPIWHLHCDDPMELLNPSLRHSLVRALMHTHTIMEPQTAHINQIKKGHKTALLDSKNLSDLPDTAVLFRRYLDSGRAINVYDWFESFAQAMTSEREEPGPEDGTRMGAGEWDDGDKDDKDGEWRREIQARFLRGVHELDWNGLLRSTGRKRDHVARTLFDPPPPGYDAL